MGKTRPRISTSKRSATSSGNHERRRQSLSRGRLESFLRPGSESTTNPKKTNAMKTTRSLTSKSLVTAVALLLLCGTVLSAAEKKIILPEGAKAGGNYSPGILVDGTLYISGQ